MNDVLIATSQNFNDEVLQSDKPVLVDFWAPWCGPCRMVAPTVEEIASEYAGKVKVVKLNTDENLEIASQYQIMSIPTLGIFQGGKMVDHIIGAVPKRAITDKLNYYLQGVSKN
jgi:thioredoxin 1